MKNSTMKQFLKATSTTTFTRRARLASQQFRNSLSNCRTGAMTEEDMKSFMPRAMKMASPTGK